MSGNNEKILNDKIGDLLVSLHCREEEVSELRINLAAVEEEHNTLAREWRTALDSMQSRAIASEAHSAQLAAMLKTAADRIEMLMPATLEGSDHPCATGHVLRWCRETLAALPKEAETVGDRTWDGVERRVRNRAESCGHYGYGLFIDGVFQYDRRKPEPTGGDESVGDGRIYAMAPEPACTHGGSKCNCPACWEQRCERVKARMEAIVEAGYGHFAQPEPTGEAEMFARDARVAGIPAQTFVRNERHGLSDRRVLSGRAYQRLENQKIDYGRERQPDSPSDRRGSR